MGAWPLPSLLSGLRLAKVPRSVKWPRKMEVLGLSFFFFVFFFACYDERRVTRVFDRKRNNICMEGYRQFALGVRLHSAARDFQRNGKISEIRVIARFNPLNTYPMSVHSK